MVDSTPLFDAVATQDTVIQLRAAIRKVLAGTEGADPVLAGAVRAALTRDDDYATLGKPPCNWDDPKAREALVDALVRDARAALGALDGHQLDGPAAEAADLLALVARRAPAGPRSTGRRSPATPGSTTRRSPAGPRSTGRRSPATPGSKREFSGRTSFAGTDFGSGAIAFDNPRQWGPPVPRSDWDGDRSMKPENVTPQSWPPTPVS